MAKIKQHGMKSIATGWLQVAKGYRDFGDDGSIIWRVVVGAEKACVQ